MAQLWKCILLRRKCVEGEAVDKDENLEFIISPWHKQSFFNDFEKWLEHSKLSNKVVSQEKAIFKLQSEFDRLDQYGRWENLEFAGIPDAINNDDLESKVIEICSDINVDIKPSDIVACHLPRSSGDSKNLPKRTIVRFKSRKHCDLLKFNRKKLKTLNLSNSGLLKGTVYINENLCPTFRNLWWNCKKLYNVKKIHSFWGE